MCVRAQTLTFSSVYARACREAPPQPAVAARGMAVARGARPDDAADGSGGGVGGGGGGMHNRMGGGGGGGGGDRGGGAPRDGDMSRLRHVPHAPGGGGGSGGDGVGGGGGAMSDDSIAAFRRVTEQQLVPSQEYALARASDVARIEEHIVELGQVFNKLSTMIDHQGHSVDRRVLPCTCVRPCVCVCIRVCLACVAHLQNCGGVYVCARCCFVAAVWWWWRWRWHGGGGGGTVVEASWRVRRLAENIEDTVDNVASGHNELVTHWQSVSSNWQLGLKIFLILVVFIVIFVMFLA